MCVYLGNIDIKKKMKVGEGDLLFHEKKLLVTAVERG